LLAFESVNDGYDRLKRAWPALSSARPVSFFMFILTRKYLDLQVESNKKIPEIKKIEKIVEQFSLVSKHAALFA
jgi:hypothetical protein